MTLPATTATTGEVWCLLINHEKPPIGDIFYLGISPKTCIAHLKEKVMEKNPTFAKEINPDELVWRCMDRTTAFDVNDNEPQALAFSNVERLDTRQKVAGLSIIDSETLLVQMPSAFPPSSTLTCR
jgi:hypothetical protein